MQIFETKFEGILQWFFGKIQWIFLDTVENIDNKFDKKLLEKIWQIFFNLEKKFEHLHHAR